MSLCIIVIVFFLLGFLILMIWNCWVRVVFCLKYFLYLVYVVVVIVWSLLWVKVGLSRLVVLFWFVCFLVLIMVWVLLMNIMIGFGEDFIFLIMDFNWFLNLFLILVLVCNNVRLSEWIEIFCRVGGILLLVILSVNFFIMVVFLIFVLLVRIGLFCCCW